MIIQTSRQLWYGHMSGCWFFTFFGIIHIVYTYVRYFRCMRSRRNSYYMPTSALVLNFRGRRIPIEGWCKLIAFIFLTGVSAFFTSRGPFQQDAMSSFHIPLTFLAATAGLIDILVAHKIAPRRMDYLWWSAMHFLAGYLVANHHYPEFTDRSGGHGGHGGHSGAAEHVHRRDAEMAMTMNSTDDAKPEGGHTFTPLEGSLHNLFALILYAGGIFLILEIYTKGRSVLFTLCRTTVYLLMGIWLGVASYYLYPADPKHPPLDMYSTESVIVCTGLFAWAIVGVMSFTPIVGFVIQRCMAPDLAILRKRHSETRGGGAHSDDDSSDDYDLLVEKGDHSKGSMMA